MKERLLIKITDVVPLHIFLDESFGASVWEGWTVDSGIRCGERRLWEWRDTKGGKGNVKDTTLGRFLFESGEMGDSELSQVWDLHDPKYEVSITWLVKRNIRQGVMKATTVTGKRRIRQLRWNNMRSATWLQWVTYRPPRCRQLIPKDKRHASRAPSTSSEISLDTVDKQKMLRNREEYQLPDKCVIQYMDRCAGHNPQRGRRRVRC